ncbi:MAG: acyltransferase [Methylococcales bacterium]|nr:acyltransferase [Methylococcales bacterium]
MKNPYLYRLDHLRFYASVYVILFHCISRIDHGYDNTLSFTNAIVLWLTNGKSGVSLFLVLSGFLFTYLAKAGERKIIYWKFILNRILRIYPLLTLIFLAIICIDRANSSPMDIFRLLTLQLNTGNPGTGWGNNVLPVGLIWTIAVEFQFYLIFPLLMRYVHENSWLTLLGLIGFINILKLIIVLYAGEIMYFNLYHSTIGRLDQFMVGIIAGIFYLHKTEKIESFFKKYGWYFIILLVCLFTLLFEQSYGPISLFMSTPGFLLEAILCVGVIFSYLHIKLPLESYANKFLCACGERSYAIYLLHYMVAEVLFEYYYFKEYELLERVFLNTFLLILPATLIVADISYRFVEKPFMSMKVSYFK